MSEHDQTPPDDVIDLAAVKARARDAVRAAIDAGKLGPGASFDAVRFQVDASVPVWALKGAWEEARANFPEDPPEAWDNGRDPGGEAFEGYDLDARESDDAKPTIRIVAGELNRMVRDTIRALGEHDHNLFQRAGQLVTIIREPERREPYEPDPNDPDAYHEKRRGSDILTRPGTPRLCDASDMILLRADAAARWERFDARRGERQGGGHGGKASGEWVPANPDATTIRELVKSRRWPGIRPVRGILENPCLGPRGRLIVKPGYDEETGYFLLPSCDIGEIVDAPTREQARAALRYLWTECFCDFPFRGLGEPDTIGDPERKERFRRALEVPDAFVGIAMLLTILARPAIVGATPGGLFEAAGQGSGKSKQIHVVSMIATSRPAGVATFPMREGKPNEEELEKVIMGYALASARLIAFDNIRGLLAGATIERALTSEDTIEGRVLGLTGQVAVAWIAVLFFSGNNMVMSDDIAQRLLVSRLESPREDPRSRPSNTFRHSDLLGWIKANRARLVRAVLVILRCYVAARNAGADVPILSRGNFESWASIVASAIVWAGGPNVIAAFPEAGRGGDEESEAHTTLLRSWRDAWQNQRASIILDGIFAGEKEEREGGYRDEQLTELRAAVRSLTRTRERDVPSAHVFGMRLRALRGKPRGTLKLEICEDKGNKVSLYRVVDVAAPRTEAQSA